MLAVFAIGGQGQTIQHTAIRYHMAGHIFTDMSSAACLWQFSAPAVASARQLLKPTVQSGFFCRKPTALTVPPGILQLAGWAQSNFRYEGCIQARWNTFWTYIPRAMRTNMELQA